MCNNVGRADRASATPKLRFTSWTKKEKKNTEFKTFYKIEQKHKEEAGCIFSFILLSALELASLSVSFDVFLRVYVDARYHGSVIDCCCDRITVNKNYLLSQRIWNYKSLSFSCRKQFETNSFQKFEDQSCCDSVS